MLAPVFVGFPPEAIGLYAPAFVRIRTAIDDDKRGRALQESGHRLEEGGMPLHASDLLRRKRFAA